MRSLSLIGKNSYFHAVDGLPRCRPGDNVCIERKFTQLFDHGRGRFTTVQIRSTISSKYDSMKSFFRIYGFVLLDFGRSLPSLNPFRPQGALSSFTINSLDTGMGSTVNGVATDLSIYGFNRMRIQQIR